MPSRAPIALARSTPVLAASAGISTSFHSARPASPAAASRPGAALACSVKFSREGGLAPGVVERPGPVPAQWDGRAPAAGTPAMRPR